MPRQKGDTSVRFMGNQAKIYTVEYRRAGMARPWYQAEYSKDAKSDFTENVRSARLMTHDEAQAALRMAVRGPGLEAQLMIVPHDWPRCPKCAKKV